MDTSALDTKIGATDPGLPDAKATNKSILEDAIKRMGSGTDIDALLNGDLGGERIATLGNYDGGKIGAFINNLNRKSENTSRSNQMLAQDQGARRGLISGSQGDLARLLSQQALDDSTSANAAQGMQLDEQAKNNWNNQQFQINSHNSDVARLGAQAKLSGSFQNQNALQSQAALLAQIQGQGFDREMQSKGMYNTMQQQNFMNQLQKLGYSATEAQRLFTNANTATNQNTALNQRSIDNVRTEQGLDEKNYQDRMGMLGFLQQQQQQAFGNGMSQQQMGLAQSNQGNQVNQNQQGLQYGAQMANAASQNAYNGAVYQQGINQSAQNQQTMQGALALGAQGYMNYAAAPPATTTGGTMPTSNPAAPAGSSDWMNAPPPAAPAQTSAYGPDAPMYQTKPTPTNSPSLFAPLTGSGNAYNQSASLFNPPSTNYGRGSK